MKKIYFTLTLAALVINTGCSVKSGDDIAKDIQKDTQEKIDQMNKDNEQTLNAVRESSVAGGQPARVNLKGPGLKSGEHLNTKYFSIGAFGGQRCESEEVQAVEASRVATLSNVEEDQNIKAVQKSEKTFINIGCGNNLDKALTLDLKDVTPADSDSIWIVNASKIFICGDVDLSKMSLVLLKADETFLSNAVLKTNSRKTINLSLATNKLILNGENSFASVLKEETLPSLVSPTTEISLTVVQETQGEGILSITAKGANCIKAEKE